MHNPNSTPSPGPLSLLEIEERLWEDSSGTYRAALDERLVALELRVQAVLRELQPPAAHQQCLAIANGVAAARRVLASSCRSK